MKWPILTIRDTLVCYNLFVNFYWLKIPAQYSIRALTHSTNSVSESRSSIAAAKFPLLTPSAIHCLPLLQRITNVFRQCYQSRPYFEAISLLSMIFFKQHWKFLCSRSHLLEALPVVRASQVRHSALDLVMKSIFVRLL